MFSFFYPRRCAMARPRYSKKPRGFLVQKPLGQFTDRVQAVGPEHFGVVAIDCAKARSKFLLCDFYGNVLIEPTPVEHTQSELRAACDRVRSAMGVHALTDIVVAIERTGTYHRPVQDAFRRAHFETRLVHPFAAKQFRQPADPDNKTDDTDLAGIFRAAVNGFGLLQPSWPDVYLELQQLSRSAATWCARSAHCAVKSRKPCTSSCLATLSCSRAISSIPPWSCHWPVPPVPPRRSSTLVWKGCANSPTATTA